MADGIVRTACTRDCPDACEIVATVAQGKIVRLQGVGDHPVTRGFLCHRTSRFLERQYAAERLRQPLERRGTQFYPLSWEVALDRIAGAIERICAESGPAAIMHYRCGGSLGLSKHLTDWFFAQLGPVTAKCGDVCSGAGEAAQEMDFGLCDSSDLFDLYNSRTILLWGKNPHVSNVHLLPVLKEAKRRGARLVLLDPVRHRAAAYCDLVLQPRPGGDAALACGIARWLFAHGREAEEAIGYSDNYEAYRALVFSQTHTEWAVAAGVTDDELAAVASLYADGPAAILVGWGMQRRTHGAATVRALDALATISGNIGRSGGGVSFYFKRRGAFDFDCFADAPPPARTIPEPQLGRGILAASDPPVRMLFVTAANPVAMLPESPVVAQALESREMTVVVDSFLTDSARHAHLILPATTFLEEEDLVGAYGHHWIAAVQPVVAPAPGTRSDFEIVRALAERLGFAERMGDSFASWRDKLLQRVESAGVSWRELSSGAVRNPFAAPVLFADHRFPTASGRVQLLNALAPELRAPAPHRPLRLAALSTEKAQAAQWPLAAQRGLPPLRVHPSRLSTELPDGAAAVMASRQGQLQVLVIADERVHPEMALMDKGGWLSSGWCANSLIPADLTDAGAGAVYYDTEITLSPSPRLESTAAEQNP